MVKLAAVQTAKDRLRAQSAALILEVRWLVTT
jgi:hypothetical protein